MSSNDQNMAYLDLFKAYEKCLGYNVNTSADKINFSHALFNRHKYIYNTVTNFCNILSQQEQADFWIRMVSKKCI